MSEIRSNSVGEFEPDDIDSIDPKAKVLQTILSVPISVPQEISINPEFSEMQELENQVAKKIGFFLKLIMGSFRYKNQMKKMSIKVAEFDKTKTFNGLKSCQKDIVKFGVILKHHEIEFCREYLTKVLAKMLVGERDEEEY